jgi:hypothetical protein
VNDTPKRKTLIGETMINAVQILIDRLKSHPDEFFGEVGDGSRGLAKWGSPKFAGVERRLNELVAGNRPDQPMREGVAHPYWFLEPEELNALIVAYKEASRARFDAEIVHNLLTPEPEPVQYQEAMRIDSTGNIGIGLNTASRVMNAQYHNISRQVVK